MEGWVAFGRAEEEEERPRGVIGRGSGGRSDTDILFFSGLDKTCAWLGIQPRVYGEPGFPSGCQPSGRLRLCPADLPVARLFSNYAVI